MTASASGMRLGIVSPVTTTGYLPGARSNRPAVASFSSARGQTVTLGANVAIGQGSSFAGSPLRGLGANRSACRPPGPVLAGPRRWPQHVARSAHRAADACAGDATRTRIGAGRPQRARPHTGDERRTRVRVDQCRDDDVDADEAADPSRRCMVGAGQRCLDARARRIRPHTLRSAAARGRLCLPRRP